MASPKNFDVFDSESFYHIAPALDFVAEIGEKRVRHISIAHDTPLVCTVFYEADGLLTCPDCNWDYSPSSSFCHICGKSLVPLTETERPACLHCGKPLFESSNFCRFCGKPVEKPRLSRKK